MTQEYIDTQKAGLPSRSEFRIDGSSHFSAAELGTNGYDPFLFNQDFLDSLEAVRTEFGRPMIVHQTYGERRAYSSPGNHFTSTPAVGLPTYWEDDPESPHIYGYAVDIRVDDWTPPAGLQDDWVELATMMVSHGLDTSNAAGDWSYIHASFDLPEPPEPMIEVSITPNTIEPGWDTDYQTPAQTRQFDISGRLLFHPPFTGYLALRVGEVLYSGGHAAAGRPMNHFPAPCYITEFGHDGTFDEITFEDICEWGGQIKVQATYFDGNKVYRGADIASITFNYLMQMPEYEHVVQVGETTFHPRNTNHYLDINIDQLEMIPDIVARFYLKLDSAGLAPPFPLVYMNDISLSNGGRFPIRSWTDSSHQRHRQGAEADMYYGGWVYLSLRWSLMRSAIWEITGKDPEHEPPHHDNHFHTYFPSRPWE